MNDLMSKSWRSSFCAASSDQKEKDLEKGGDGRKNALPGMNLTKFTKATGRIEADISKASERLALMRATHGEIIEAVSLAKVAALHKKMDAEVGTISKLAKAVNDQLKALRADNEANRKYPGCEENSATDRQRMMVTHNLVLKLKDLTDEFNELRSKIADDHRQTVERRLFIVIGKKPSEEDVDKIIRTGQSEQILQQAVKAQGLEGQVRGTVLEIQERHEAVKEITRGLEELQQDFLDMSSMVEEQGEMANNIEANVEKSTNNVAKAGKHLLAALRKKREKQELICFGIIALVVIIFIICIPTVASVVSNYSK